MRRLIDKITNLGTVPVGFITVIIMIALSNICVVASIEELIEAVRETNQANESVVMSYEEPEEVIVPVYFDNEEYNYNGNMIYTFGDISDEFYFFIFINEEQGIYEYYFPAMHADWPIECDSLEELQHVVMCHIDQAYPNARFVIEWN